LAKKGRNKSKEDLGPGDLVFFGDSDRISHVAIVASHNGDSLTVIHATTSAGVKVDNINGSAYWESRFLFGRDILSD
jgi:cell wall-associated NlpC family hydrolase